MTPDLPTSGVWPTPTSEGRPIAPLGLRFILGTAPGVSHLFEPAEHLLPNGAFPVSRKVFDALREYSTSLPTGTTPGKVWKAQTRGGWYLGRYGEPYPEGHEYHGEIPIDWWRLQVEGEPARCRFRVPPAPMRGRQRDPVPGIDEGELCLREQDGETCLTRLELAPAPGLGGCTCFICAPCGSCLSTVPECPRGCYRGEEP
jgi:hypothetical protein